MDQLPLAGSSSSSSGSSGSNSSSNSHLMLPGKGTIAAALPPLPPLPSAETMPPAPSLKSVEKLVEELNKSLAKLPGINTLNKSLAKLPGINTSNGSNLVLQPAPPTIKEVAEVLNQTSELLANRSFNITKALQASVEKIDEELEHEFE